MGTAVLRSRIHSYGPDAAAVLALLALAVAWYAPGIFQHKVFVAEDIVSIFYATCYQIHQQVHGPGLTLWNPLLVLGVPRLGSMDFCYYSPTSFLFYLLPTSVAFGIYPTLMLFGLSVGSYALFRLRRVSPLSALYGAVSWCTVGVILDHMQHIPVMSTLVWLCPTLCAWERFRQTGHGGWAAAAAVGVAQQIFGASPQYLIYNMLLCAAWVGLDLWETRQDRRCLLKMAGAALGLLVCGILLGTIQLLPAAELAGVSERNLLPASSDFADTYRSAPWEVALSLVRETFLVTQVPGQVHATSPYPNYPALSLVTTLLALLALRRNPRQAVYWWVLSAVALLGMLGKDGPVIPVLRTVLPVLRSLRASSRMIVPAAFMVSWLAATALDTLRPRYRWLALGWLVGSGWYLLHGSVTFADAQSFEPPLPASYLAPRLAVAHSAGPWLLNSGIMVGCPTILTVVSLMPQEAFGAIVASQRGRLDPGEVEFFIGHQNLVDMTRMNMPILRAFGVRSQLVGKDNGVAVRRLPAPPPYWMVPQVREVGPGDARWAVAAGTDWDPEKVAWVAAPRPVLPPTTGASQVVVVEDSADQQTVDVSGGGGLLLASAQYFPGWEVTIDGQPATAVEADLALRAVVVPAGTHEVRWQYRPAWIRPALAAVGLALLGMGWMGWRLRLL